MAVKLKLGSAQLVANARGQIREIDAPDAIGMMDCDDVVIVDLRDVRERERSGYIPESFHCPRGMAEFWVDPDSPYFKEIFATGATLYFIVPRAGARPSPYWCCRKWAWTMWPISPTVLPPGKRPGALLR